ncbi:3-methyl-2-oxobutanoate hydroxymethyltransferase [Stetteria hydrogenophila]
MSCRSGRRKVTAPALASMKGRQRIVMVTAYDYPTAALADEAGVDSILVGDSLGMVVLGYESTLPVTVEDMLRHTAAVARAKPCALIVADMPFLSYEASTRDAVLNAGALARAGAEAVKLEGGSEVADVVKAIVRAGIPVMGHVGLTPQRAARLGGYRRMGKTPTEAEAIVRDAKALEEAGAFAVVVEFTKADVARRVTESIGIPTICIGSGPHCDGQVLVLHDIIGLSFYTPPFAKRYADAASLIRKAIEDYAREVREGKFPGPEHYK